MQHTGPSNQRIQDYRFVLVDAVYHWLKQGYQPYGPPLVTFDKQIGQVVVFYDPSKTNS